MRSLVRFSPNVEARQLQREFDRLFNDFFPTPSTDNDEAVATWTPRVDLSETEDAYHIHLDLPGIVRDDLNLNYHDGLLSISGERRSESREEETNYVRIERQAGPFYRSYKLTKTIDSTKIEAKYEDGVLHIRAPKAEESKPQRISVS
jgi:HSP20 family protein